MSSSIAMSLRSIAFTLDLGLALALWKLGHPVMAGLLVAFGFASSWIAIQVDKQRARTVGAAVEHYRQQSMRGVN